MGKSLCLFRFILPTVTGECELKYCQKRPADEDVNIIGFEQSNY